MNRVVQVLGGAALGVLAAVVMVLEYVVSVMWALATRLGGTKIA